MAADLLEKEEEYLKLNAELEVRTKALMQQADSVMKLQNHYVVESIKSPQLTKISGKTNGQEASQREMLDKIEGLPEECKNMGVKALIHFLKTKVVLLTSELNETKSNYKTKMNEFKQLQSEYAKVEEEKIKWHQTSQFNKEQKEKIASQLSVINSKMQTRDTELISLKKENEFLKKELKSINLNKSNSEFHLKKALEEVEKLRTDVKNYKEDEKNMKVEHKKQINDANSSNKYLEKQTAELTNGFKKQMLLIDNLKKQKMYLEMSKALDIKEDEFVKVLDWKPNIS